MSDTQTKLVGKVKWFNNKAGYGFITVSEGEFADKDIFVHYSTINVSNPQYKYLVQGEYVEFDLVKSTNEKHEFNAVNVSGIKGGSIMCESRRLNRPEGDEAPSTRPVRTNTRPRPPRREVPLSTTEDDGFTNVVVKKRTSRGPYKKKESTSA